MVLGRARRRTLVLDAGEQSNRAAAHIGGLLGHDGMPPGDFYELARAQVATYDAVVLRDEEAVDARSEGDGFVAVLGGAGGEVRARRWCWLPGWSTRFPTWRGSQSCGAARCSTARSATAGTYATDPWSSTARERSPICKPRCSARGATTSRSSSPTRSRTCASRTARCRLWFATTAPRFVATRYSYTRPCGQRSALPERLGLALTDGGLVAVDARMRTSLPGAFAAGDVAVAPQQVAIALGSGHLAGVAVTRELLLGRG